MRKIILFLCSVVLFFACKNETKNVSAKNSTNQERSQAEKIIDSVIKKAGGETYETASIDFDFRDKHYQSKRRCGQFSFTRTFKDSTGKQIKDVLSNEGFTRYVNQEKQNLPDSLATSYSNSVNSVHYFMQLPFGLNDTAVNKELLGETTIENKPYYEIKVWFDAEGGGEDHEDEYIYWVNKNNYYIDYFAYSYEVNGGGMRFRKAYNPRVIKGLRFVDYKNYAPKEAEEANLENLEQLYQNDKLKLFSAIENKNIKVSLAPTDCG